MNRENDHIQSSDEGIEDIEGIEKSISEFIRTLQLNKHALQPTKYETILKMFGDSDYGSVNIEAISALFENLDDPKRSVHMKISKLNTKLLPYGIQISRSSNYEIKRVKPNSSDPTEA